MSFKILVAPKSGFLVPEDHPAWMKCLMDDVCHEFFGLTSTHPPLISTTRTPHPLQLSISRQILLFFPPSIYSLSLLQRVTSSSPGLNAPAPTYLMDHLTCPGLHASSLRVHPAFSPPPGYNKSFTHFSASSGVSLVVCLFSAGARGRTCSWEGKELGMPGANFRGIQRKIRRIKVETAVCGTGGGQGK